MRWDRSAQLRLVGSFTLLTMMVQPATAQDVKPPAPASWAIATADTIMERYPDFRTAYFRPWTYVHGYDLYGFEMLYRSTGEKKYLDYLKRYVDQIVDEKGNLTYVDRKTDKVVPVSLTNLDNVMTGNIIVAMYEYTHEERYRLAAEHIRKAFDVYPRNSDGGFWHAKSLKGQMWIDGVFMGQMFLTRYGKSIGDSAYCFDEATKQITVFAKHCLKGDTGLYYHGWTESPDTTKWADQKTGLSSEVWSEGLGWYALIVVETLAVLPQDHARRAEVEDILRRLAAGLKRTQDPKTGRWFQVVDKGDQPDNWTDNSGSAMFVYALQRAIELGLIGEKEYSAVVAKGYRGIIANARLNEQKLVDVESACDGVGVQKDYAHYVNYKKSVNAKEAVGGFLWATAIVEKPGLKHETRVRSPNGLIQVKVFVQGERLKFGVTFKNNSVLEPSPMQFTVDGLDVTEGVEVGQTETSQVKETYPWRGVHALAKNHYNGATLAIKHVKSNTNYSLEVRAFDDGVGFRYVVPGKDEKRVPDEATTLVLPAGSTVWYHDLEGHYEGVHVSKAVADVKTGEWAAPPLTFELPGGSGYASITEAALVNYSGMALQADGQRGFSVRLGHSHPPSYPFRLRYGAEEAKRLSEPAAITGTITTPWRVVMIGPDLNALVNCDVVHDLCPPPDPKLFPKGFDTEWVKPGRAVWKYLDGGANTLEGMKEFSRLAGGLGFEHHIIEGFWSKWTDAEIRDLVGYAKERHVGIWLWKHSKSLRDADARHEFLKRCHDLGVVGVKIDFFDHEAKEVIDLYQALLREAAEYQLLVDFHGANKPTGESRTWPNELTREAVKGMEASKLADRATHDVTLPFTRLLAGPAEYTPLHFGDRRKNTTWAHQAASGVILSAPLLTYAANPSTILANPCCAMIESVPSTWDETIVLPPSEIGEVAVFARRKGDNWFLAVMNGTAARKMTIPLSFLGEGEYGVLLIGDGKVDSAAVIVENTTLKRSDPLPIDLREGGGFIARFSRK